MGRRVFLINRQLTLLMTFTDGVQAQDQVVVP
jgi:hypothetical protein